MIYARSWLAMKNKIHSKKGAKFVRYDSPSNFLSSSFNLDLNSRKVLCILQQTAKCTEQHKSPPGLINFSIYMWNTACFSTFSPKQYGALIMHLLIFRVSTVMVGIYGHRVKLFHPFRDTAVKHSELNINAGCMLPCLSCSSPSTCMLNARSIYCNENLT